MKHTHQIGWTILLLITSAAGGYYFYQFLQTTQSNDHATRLNQPVVVTREVLESFQMKDLKGNEHRLSQWFGQPQIINYWATWCSPCRKEIPLLINLQKKHAADNLVVIGLSMDFPDDIEVVKAFVNQQKIDYPILMGVDFGNAIATAFGASNSVLPISIFVRADGSVSHTHTGLLTAEQADRFLADTL